MTLSLLPDEYAPRSGYLRERTKTGKKVADAIKAAKEKIVWPNNYVICKDTTDLGRIAREISKHGEFAYDTETGGLNAWRDAIQCISIYVGGVSYLVNFEHHLLPKFTHREVTDILGSYFTDPAVKVIGFNLPFDSHFLEQQLGLDLGEFPMYHDSMVAAWLLWPDAEKKALKELCFEHLGLGESGAGYTGQYGRTSWKVLDPTVAAFYACKDAELHWKLYQHTKAELAARPELEKLMYDLDMPVQNIYYRTEREGLPVDRDYLKNDLGMKMEIELAVLKAEINRMAAPTGWTGDIDKPEHLADLLFNRLKLPRSKKGNSTDKAVLTELKDAHEIVPQVMDYRALYKLKTGFVDALPELLTEHGPGDWRVHPSFKTTGSETGRSTCNAPNLLQMPARAGNQIRRAFMARPGRMLVSKDFSGQELRIQAALSGDSNLQYIVLSGGDFYSEAAAIFYGGTAADYTKSGPKKSQRDKAKIAILAMSYGAQAFKLAQVFGCSVKRAEQFTDDFFARFPGLKKLTDSNIAYAKKHGYVRSYLGRQRPVKYFRGMSEKDSAALDRVCANTPIQASAADQTKLALVLCDEHLRNNNYKSRVLFPIHDEILFDVDTEEWNTTPLADELSFIMENAVIFPGVPMKTSTEVYPNRWGEHE